MPLEKRHEFLLEGNLPMVFFLVGDVFLHLNQIGMAHAERAIADLPCERLLARKILVNPAGRIRLQRAHQIGQRMFRRQRRQNVDVIRRAVDDERLAVMRADDAAEIGKETGFQIRVEQWPPVFRAENNVRQEMGESVRHKISCEAWIVSATAWRAVAAFQSRSGGRQ